VLAGVGRGDWILCQITSKPYGDSQAIRLDDNAFSSGSLRVLSYARPGKIFTANHNLIVAKVGTLNLSRLKEITETVVQILRAGIIL
jgi:mRNA interferase MazF